MEDFLLLDDQVGAILKANNSWAIEIFDNKNSYAQYHEALVASFMVEALEAIKYRIPTADVKAGKLMGKLWDLNWVGVESIGVGECFANLGSNTNSLALLQAGVAVSVSVTGFVVQA